MGIVEVGGSFDRDQIEMSNATSVRLVVTIGPSALPSGSYAQAEYTPDGTNWFALRGSTCDNAKRALLEHLARSADWSERRLRGTHCGIERWDCR